MKKTRKIETPLEGTPVYELLDALKGLKECQKETRGGLYDIIFYTLKHEKLNTSEQEAFLH